MYMYMYGRELRKLENNQKLSPKQQEILEPMSFLKKFMKTNSENKDKVPPNDKGIENLDQNNKHEFPVNEKGIENLDQTSITASLLLCQIT